MGNFDEEEYTPEKILEERKMQGGSIEYLVKWLNWPIEDSTWEPVAALRRCTAVRVKWKSIKKKTEAEAIAELGPEIPGRKHGQSLLGKRLTRDINEKDVDLDVPAAHIPAAPATAKQPRTSLLQTRAAEQPAKAPADAPTVVMQPMLQHAALVAAAAAPAQAMVVSAAASTPAPLFHPQLAAKDQEKGVAYPHPKRPGYFRVNASDFITKSTTSIKYTLSCCQKAVSVRLPDEDAHWIVFKPPHAIGCNHPKVA